jgi:sulfate adenylyltransferase
MPSHLITPYAGKLVDLLVDQASLEKFTQEGNQAPSWDLTPRQHCDLELLLNGGFSPLTGYMDQEEVGSVRQNRKLPDGTFWPEPVVLEVADEFAATIQPGGKVALRDLEGVILALLEVSQVFKDDSTGRSCLAGKLFGLKLPIHYDFSTIRRTPAEVRQEFARRGWRRIVTFQTDEVMHRRELEMTFELTRQIPANLLVQPVIGVSSPEDVDHYTFVRALSALMPRYPRNTAMLSLLPLPAIKDGTGWTLLRAIVAQNYGCTHLILDNAAFAQVSDEDKKQLQIELIPALSLVYSEDQDAYLTPDELEAVGGPDKCRTRELNRESLKQRFDEGRDIPSWFSFAEVIEELKKANRPRRQQGVCIFFTGLPCSGKSTVANVLRMRLLEMGGRPVTLLDGDVVRKYLSSELGFSKEHRDINIRRIGYVASEITKNGGIAICAPIAPYDSVRREVRRMIEKRGGFILVHVSTPLETCEQRDRKGMYAKARAGIIKEYTGISDPYEVPEDAGLAVDTSDITPEEAAQQVLLYLEKRGWVGI